VQQFFINCNAMNYAKMAKDNQVKTKKAIIWYSFAAGC